MIRWLFVLATLPACDVVFHVDQLQRNDGGATADTLPPIDAACSGTLVGRFGPNGTGMLEVCVPATATVVKPTAIDTNDQSCLDADNVCVITGTTVTLGTIVVTGHHSLVIAAAEEIDVTGLLDLTRETWTTDDCSGTGLGVTFNQASGASGGGGGGWSSAGGHGGYGTMSPGGSGGSVLAAPTALRGGCAGAAGGGGDTASPPVAGGDGGSAIYLTAPRIVLGAQASINVSGHGGSGGAHGTMFGAGGGGGGSGGLLVLDGKSILTGGNGPFLANGGGGGGGGGAVTGDGATGGTAMTAAAAPGGPPGNSVGSSGGNGGFSSSTGMDASAATGDGGGGGGGGGQGWILYYSAVELTGLVASPPAKRGT